MGARRVAVSMLAAALLSGVLAACAGGDASTDVAARDALDFVAADVRTGESVDASSYAGRDLVLWFWAPW